MDKSKSIFGNAMSGRTYKKAVAGKKKYIRRFGDDSKVDYELKIRDNKHIGDILGVKDIVVAKPQNKDRSQNGDTAGAEFDRENGLIVGNIRMGFGQDRKSVV